MQLTWMHFHGGKLQPHLRGARASEQIQWGGRKAGDVAFPCALCPPPSLIICMMMMISPLPATLPFPRQLAFLTSCLCSKQEGLSSRGRQAGRHSAEEAPRCSSSSSSRQRGERARRQVGAGTETFRASPPPAPQSEGEGKPPSPPGGTSGSVQGLSAERRRAAGRGGWGRQCVLR